MSIKTVEQYITLVSDYTKVSRDEIMARRRKENIVEARQIVMFLLKRYTALSSLQIGELLDKDHSTVIVACKKVKYYLHYDKYYRERYQSLFDKAYELYQSIEEEGKNTPKIGQVCWFWNDGMVMPIISRLIFIDNDKGFAISAGNKDRFAHCEFAGPNVLPKAFKRGRDENQLCA